MPLRFRLVEVDKRFERWGIYKVLAAGAAAVAVVSFVQSCQNATRQRQYQAWELLSLSAQLEGSGGRVLALEDLHSDGIRLNYVNLANSDLTKIRLSNGVLRFVSLQESIVDYADLRGADLRDVLAGSASFRWTCLEGADLAEGDFEDADFYGADLQGANLRRANLRNANLELAWLDRADLQDADLTGANIRGTSLKGANLGGATLSSLRYWELVKDLTVANIRAIRKPPQGFREWVLEEWRGEESFSVTLTAWEQRRDEEDYKPGLPDCHDP